MTELAPWVRPVAKDWELRRIRTLGRTGSGSGFPPSCQGRVDLEVPFYKVKHLGQSGPDGVLGRADDTISRETAEYLGATVFPAGTLVYAKVGAALMLGRVRVLPVDACIDNNMAGLAPGSGVDQRYLYWAMSQVRFDYLVNPGAVPSLSDKKLLDFPLLLPPYAEQRAIADYLDRETARIDTLIEEQQRLIETLRERRTAVISRSVARGLDDLVALEESGLPGAGPVPEHWQIMPLRYAIFFQEGPGIMAADFRDEGVPLLRVRSVRSSQTTLAGCNYLDADDVVRRWSHFRVDLGDLLISASASMGTVSEVTEETVGAVPYTGIIRIKAGRMIKDFVRWFLVSDEFMDQVDSLKTGSTIQHFGPTHLAQMRVALPPRDEQRRIAAYLDGQTAKIDALIAEAERFIELSKERRAALITAAVTGQIDVRGVA